MRIQQDTEKLAPVRSECPSDKRSIFQGNKQTNKLYLGQRKPSHSLLVAHGMLESSIIGNNQGQLLAVGSGSTQKPAENSAFLGSAPCILTPGRCPNSPFKQTFR